jgi:hypothetical protein
LQKVRTLVLIGSDSHFDFKQNITRPNDIQAKL